MIGKIILWILLGILILLAVLLLVPVRVRGSYKDGEAFLSVRYGPVKLQLFPPPKKKETLEKKAKKPKKEKKPKPEKPKKPKVRINADQILYAIEKLPPILTRALKRTGRSIHVRPLQLYVLVAGTDPAATAMMFGKMEAAFAAGFPLLEETLHIKDADVRLYVDFVERQMDFIVDAGISFRPWNLVWMALRAGGSLVKWFIGFRKLASPPPEPEKDTSEKSETEHEAA